MNGKQIRITTLVRNNGNKKANKNREATGSLTIPVFVPQSPILNFKENPFVWGAKCTGVGINCDFRLKSPSISETIQDRLIVAMER